MEVEFDSSAGDEDTTTVKAKKSADTQKRVAKKRKKKGLSEPQKPVSAYALFFKDTQNAIKAENSMATFGEISKIVASMWDSLSEEAKQVYKQKTETAKREYLKQLAAYRAAKEEEGEDEPLLVLQDKLKQQRIAEAINADLPPPPKLKIAPVVFKGVHLLQAQPSNAMMSGATNVENSVQISPNQTTSLNPLLNTTSPTLPPPIQLRSIVPKAAQGSITFLQSKPGQVIKLLPASQASSIANTSDGKTRIFKVTDLIKNGNSSQQPLSPSEDEVQPILQTLAQETGTLVNEHSNSEMENGQLSIAKGEVILVDDDDLQIEDKLDHSHTANNIRVCVRDKCENLATSDPLWNEEYCSATCVVKHCRDVFDAWTSLRRSTMPAG